MGKNTQVKTDESSTNFNNKGGDSWIYNKEFVCTEPGRTKPTDYRYVFKDMQLRCTDESTHI